MSDFGDTTGMQNPIFRIMNAHAQSQPKIQVNNPNKMNMNPQQIHQTGMMGNNQNQNMNMNQVNNPMEKTGLNNPMGQNNGMNNNVNNMNSFEQNEPNSNQGMNITQQQMMQQQLYQLMVQQQPMMNEFHKMGFQMGMNTFQMNLQNQMKKKPDFTKIKENLSKIYGEKIYYLFDLIYNDIEGKIIAQSQKPKLFNPYNAIKINFYGSIFEIELYDNFYIAGLIEYIYDEIFGEIKEEIIFGTRKYNNETTKEIIMKPRREIKKIRRNDYYRYLFLEYNGKDLHELRYKTCQQVGIKKDSELMLKFKESNLDEQNDININNSNNQININNEEEKNEKNISNKSENFNYYFDNRPNNTNVIFHKSIKSDNYNYNNFDNRPKINLIFENKTGEKKSIIIEADKSIKELIEKYINEIGEESDHFLQRYNLIYNSFSIRKENQDENVGKKFFNGGVIQVVSKQGSDGGDSTGTPFDFVDVTSNKIKLKKVTYFCDPSKTHRKIYRGLNIFGICKNKKCRVRGKEVIYRIKLNKEGLCFNVNEERENIKCPLCETKFEKKTCGFWRCEYQFVGTYYDYEEAKNVVYNSSPHETSKDEFEYFDPDENGSKTWDELLIFVLPRQKIKYKK